MGTLQDLRVVLENRSFRLLWGALSLSVIGDRLVTVALALYVTDLTGNPTDLGLVLAAHILPLVGFLAIGGAWADRLPRRRLMIGTDLVRFALHGLLAILIFSSTVEIWQLVAIEALFGTAEAFFRPASAIVPDTVDEDQLQQANALVGLTNNLAEFVGPALATALVLGIGAGAAFAVDAASFLVSAVLLGGVVVRRRGSAADASAEQPPEGEPSGGSIWREVREGFEEVRSRAWVWASLLAFGVALFAGLAPQTVLGPSIATEQYGEIGVFGAFNSALGAGTIVGALVALRWRPLYPMRLALLAFMAWPVATILFVLGAPLVIVVPATLLAGFGIALFDVWWVTALAERIPPARLSRVTSYDWMASLSLLPAGYLLAGPLAERFGAVEVASIGSAVALAALAAALLPAETRKLRRIDRAEPELGPTELRPGVGGG